MLYLSNGQRFRKFFWGFFCGPNLCLFFRVHLSMVLKLPIRFEGSTGDKVRYTLFDSGPTFSCIHPDFIKDIQPTNKIRNPIEVATASEGIYLKISKRMTPDFYINAIRMSDEFMVVPNLSEEAIIGATTLQKWRIKLDFEHDTVIIDPKIAKPILKNLK
jgi:predicted aspartyl protease